MKVYARCANKTLHSPWDPIKFGQGCHLGTPEAMVTRAQELDCFSVHPDFRLLRLYPGLVEKCRSTGLPVFPWTVDHPHVWEVLVNQLHVDGVITNDPAKLYDWLLKQAQTSGRGSIGRGPE